MLRARRDPTQEVDSPVQSMRWAPFRQGHAWKRFTVVVGCKPARSGIRPTDMSKAQPYTTALPPRSGNLPQFESAN